METCWELRNNMPFFISQVEITLQDINDNPPVFPSDTLDVTVEENISSGANIVQLKATDADEVRLPGFPTMSLSTVGEFVTYPINQTALAARL